MKLVSAENFFFVITEKRVKIFGVVKHYADKSKERSWAIVEIKIYEDKYRNDMISMVLQAKAALGRPSSLNEDLLDIKANYFQRGDMFWVAEV